LPQATYYNWWTRGNVFIIFLIVAVHDIRYFSIPHLEDAFWKGPLTVPYLIRIDLSTATLSDDTNSSYWDWKIIAVKDLERNYHHLSLASHATFTKRACHSH
jgi:hypothetical protein